MFYIWGTTDESNVFMRVPFLPEQLRKLSFPVHEDLRNSSSGQQNMGRCKIVISIFGACPL